MARCVECGKPREAHGEGDWCYPGMPNREKMTFKSMELPAGKTCNDCQHYQWCSQFLGNIDSNCFTLSRLDTSSSLNPEE